MFYLNKGLNCFCLFFDFISFYFNNGINRLENKIAWLTRSAKFQSNKTLFWWFQFLVLFGLFCFFRFETSLIFGRRSATMSGLQLTQTGLVTWNCFVECRVFHCFWYVNFLFSRIESWNPLDQSYSGIFRELHWWDWEV
jgi:hypothetical protein